MCWSLRMLGTAKEIRINSQVTFLYGLLLMDTPVLTDQQRLTFIYFVWTLDTAKRTRQE